MSHRARRRRPARPGAAAALALAAVLGCGQATLSPAPASAPAPSRSAGASPVAADSASASGSSAPASVAPSASCSSDPVASTELPWWNDRVFYEVFVRSFQDSDGDGIGDLRGLIDRLDYLNDGDPATTDDLGVTGIWLMPVAESPSYHGYDVVDYRSIEADYGTAEDFRALVDAAHERGIAVIVDLVLNHSSREHPWFVEAAAGEGPEDWYLWADERPRGVVKEGGGRVWHPLDDRFYYGYFWEGMPDLNLANPGVTAELDDVARFWVDELGVDGFRLDAIKHFFEDGAELEDVPETRVWLEGFQDRLEAVDADVLLVGEAYDATTASAAYVPEAVDITFDFGYATSVLVGLRNGRASIVADALEESLGAYPPGQRGVFLTNHDQPRTMTELGGSVEAAKAAATLLLTAPGVPFVYYGEEIGMEGTKPDERIRTPMPWATTAPGFGFTEAQPWQSFADGAETANVGRQTDDDRSLLAWYRDLIAARAAEPAIRATDTTVMPSSDEAIFAALRRSADGAALVLVNMSDEPVEGATVDLAVTGVCPTAAEVLVGDAELAPVPVGGSPWAPVERLDPYESVVLRLDP
jgi:glycosidase